MLLIYQSMMKFIELGWSGRIPTVITYPVDGVNDAIGSWDIAVLHHGAANVNPSLMISPHSHRLSTEGLNTIGKWPRGGTHTSTAKGLCKGNIQINGLS
jgi:hypothetical protein